MTDLKSIEVREGWKKFYLSLIIIWMVVMSVAFLISDQLLMDFFVVNQSFLTLTKLVLATAILCFFLYRYLDNRVKLKIDQTGILAIKNKDISWSDIWRFGSTVHKSREGHIYHLFFYLKTGEEIKIRLRRMDHSFEEIRDIVEYYALKNNISDMGHSNE